MWCLTIDLSFLQMAFYQQLSSFYQSFPLSDWNSQLLPETHRNWSHFFWYKSCLNTEGFARAETILNCFTKFVYFKIILPTNAAVKSLWGEQNATPHPFATHHADLCFALCKETNIAFKNVEDSFMYCFIQAEAQPDFIIFHVAFDDSFNPKKPGRFLECAQHYYAHLSYRFYERVLEKLQTLPPDPSSLEMEDRLLHHMQLVQHHQWSPDNILLDCNADFLITHLLARNHTFDCFGQTGKLKGFPEGCNPGYAFALLNYTCLEHSYRWPLINKILPPPPPPPPQEHIDEDSTTEAEEEDDEEQNALLIPPTNERAEKAMIWGPLTCAWLFLGFFMGLLVGNSAAQPTDLFQVIPNLQFSAEVALGHEFSSFVDWPEWDNVSYIYIYHNRSALYTFDFSEAPKNSSNWTVTVSNCKMTVDFENETLIFRFFNVVPSTAGAYFVDFANEANPPETKIFLINQNKCSFYTKHPAIFPIIFNSHQSFSLYFNGRVIVNRYHYSNGEPTVTCLHDRFQHWFYIGDADEVEIFLDHSRQGLYTAHQSKHATNYIVCSDADPLASDFEAIAHYTISQAKTLSPLTIVLLVVSIIACIVGGIFFLYHRAQYKLLPH